MILILAALLLVLLLIVGILLLVLSQMWLRLECRYQRRPGNSQIFLEIKIPPFWIYKLEPKPEEPPPEPVSQIEDPAVNFADKPHREDDVFEKLADATEEIQKKLAEIRQIIDLISSVLHGRLSAGIFDLPVSAPIRFAIDLMDEVPLIAEELYWTTRVGGSDPAMTGVLVGLAWVGKSLLFGRLTGHVKFAQTPRLAVVPNFGGFDFSVAFKCILRVKLGDIMVAGIKSARLLAFQRG
ncbi:MAG: DUF2953 domain-containing protein [Syntrophothermus sp.]